jgi:prepilin-type N-terminal cleavage/methylation domain-containing protein
MKGFSLSELLIVLAIMLILAALAVPAGKALHTAFGAVDTMPVALRRAHVEAQRTQAYSAVAVVKQDGKAWAFILVPDASYVYTEADGDLVVLRTPPDTHRYDVPDDYETAVALYDKNGHCCPGRNLRVDGAPRQSVASLQRGDSTRYLHRYLGGFVE